MKSVAPEGTGTVLQKIVVLAKLPLLLLHETTEIVRYIAHCEQMDMVACDAEVKQGDSMLVNCKPQTGAIFDSIDSEAQQEVAVMTSMGQMVDVSRQYAAIGARHRGVSEAYVLEARKGVQISMQGPSYPLLTASSQV
jgi:hypothetical protein